MELCARLCSAESAPPQPNLSFTWSLQAPCPAQGLPPPSSRSGSRPAAAAGWTPTPVPWPAERRLHSGHTVEERGRLGESAPGEWGSCIGSGCVWGDPGDQVLRFEACGGQHKVGQIRSHLIQGFRVFGRCSSGCAGGWDGVWQQETVCHTAAGLCERMMLSDLLQTSCHG